VTFHGQKARYAAKTRIPYIAIFVEKEKEND
jgi:hypothetical protein